MKVLVVSEGEHELGKPEGESALVNLCRRMLPPEVQFVRMTVRDPEVRVHLQRGRADGYERRATAWVRYAEREGFDALVFVIDQDDDHQRTPQLDKAQENMAFGVPRAMGVAIRTFDAWMLADEKALSVALGFSVPRQRDPEVQPNAKSVCKRLGESGAVLNGPLSEMYAVIASFISLSILEERCPKGFRPFARRVRAIAPVASVE